MMWIPAGRTKTSDKDKSSSNVPAIISSTSPLQISWTISRRTQCCRNSSGRMREGIIYCLISILATSPKRTRKSSVLGLPRKMWLLWGNSTGSLKLLLTNVALITWLVVQSPGWMASPHAPIGPICVMCLQRSNWKDWSYLCTSIPQNGGKC